MITLDKKIFLNHVLSPTTPTYGNSGSLIIEKSREIQNGDTSNEHILHFSNHIGTHVDSPYHFDDRGFKLTDFPADFWFCENPYLLECQAGPEETITLEKFLPLIQKMDTGTDCILFKTNFESYRETREIYCFKNPSITPDIPLYLRNNFNLKFFGVDYISISSRANREMGRKTHKAFLCREYEGEKFNSEPILLLEDLKLSSLHTHPKQIWIAPMFFQNSDGAPVTVVADVENEN